MRPQAPRRPGMCRCRGCLPIKSGRRAPGTNPGDPLALQHQQHGIQYLIGRPHLITVTTTNWVTILK